MELKYIVMTIIKILISVPTIILITNTRVDGAVLMGGHLDNTSNSTKTSNFTSNSYEMYDDIEEFLPATDPNWRTADNPPKFEPLESEEPITETEEIPDPSALVVPGYNLPENIFNKGKPFYLEKDPLTGKVDFDSSTSLLNVGDDEFDYINDDPNPDIYDKANIDRKDGTIGSHKTSDVNQLVPNFHDYLNLPVKYNPDKYVYPLISSSYANTKVQGNINKYQNLNNHKNYAVTTFKPTFSPTYYTAKTPFYNPIDDENESFKTTHKITTTTTTRPTTTKPIYLTTKDPNLMNSEMNYPSFEDYTTHRSIPDEIYLTTKSSANDMYLTTRKFTFTPPTTTRRTLSLLEQLFGEYDELPLTEKPAKPPSLFQNLPGNKNKNTYQHEEETTERNTEGNDYRNVLTGTNMGHENAYEFEDEYDTLPSESEKNVYETKSTNMEIKTTPISTSLATTKTTTTTPTSTTITTTTTAKPTTKITTRPTIKTTTPQAIKTTTRIVYESNPSTDYDSPNTDEYDMEYDHSTELTKKPYPTTKTITSNKVTSLPLGENHFGTQDLRPPIIALTHNLKEQLNHEKVQVPKPFSQPVPSSSNIHISPDQDSVSFVVGHHQSVGGGFVGTSFKEGPYDNSPFRPLIVQADSDKDSVSYMVQAKPEFVKPTFSQNFPEPYEPKIAKVGGSSVNIQPIRTSEASLSIGVPINGIKKVPGLVVDENLENEKIEFPKKGTGAKIVFPDAKENKPSTYTPNLLQPPKQPLPPSREVLMLNSKPMYHQLPSDLTPPSEQDLPPPHLERPRPPWDPRPGHFYNGRPEYIRPPRPQPKPAGGEMYKRLDNLPNILPQFRPNAKISSGPHYFDHMSSMKNGYMRQPLLDRPSNRPVGFFEKLIPPPPPKNLYNLRKVPMLDQELRMRNAEEFKKQETYEFYQHPTPPPQPILANRRKSEEDPTIETLQMIQARQDMVKSVPGPSSFKTSLMGKDATEKPLYVVYPVNSAPIKLDALDSGKKETVVVGTRAELPLPPSKINQEFSFENPQDRNDAPILKPHSKPLPSFPVKSDFPYPLERPDIGTLPASYQDTQNIINFDVKEDSKFASNNQWGAVQDIESRILTGTKINYKNPNQISVTLKTYTEKPIAVAYTPTEPYKRFDNTEKYSMPNYASPVISEIRPGLIDKAGSEITVSAVMHTHPQMELGLHSIKGKPSFEYEKKYLENHKLDLEEVPAKLEFQAPFQASVSIDGISQGWTVVRNDNKSKIDRSDQVQVEETTTIGVATTREFDIENFKPQMFGGFKPLYSYPEDVSKSDDTDNNKREEGTT